MNLEKILKNIGLNNKQAKLYLTCLEMGSASVYKISKQIKIPRSSCYEILEFLKEKNLVTTFRKKNVLYYNAENPALAIEREKEKINFLEQALPEFNALYHSEKERPTVRFYSGVDGMKIILNEMLNEADGLVSFSSFEDIFANMGE